MYKFKVHVYEGDDFFEGSFTVGQLIELNDFLKAHKFPSVISLGVALITCEDTSSDCRFRITHDDNIYIIMGGVYND